MKFSPHHGAAAAFVLAAVCALPAHAASYSFQQAGFSGGGTLSGTFTGVDAGVDGWLTHFGPAGELSAFQLSFSGDSLVGAFSLGLADLAGFSYRLDGGPLGDDAAAPGEGLAAASSAFNALAGLAALGSAGSMVVDLRTGASSATDLALAVTAIPEPATAWLLAAGLLAFGRRRSRLTRR